jgi:hypothetical protein
MPDRRYEVRVTGRLSQRARDAIVGLHVDEVTTETVIPVIHRAEGLYELLVVALSLGLRVVSVQQAARETTVAVNAPNVPLEARP